MERIALSLAANPDAPVFFVEETGSTMDLAKELVRDGAVHGTTVVTDFQSAGRGRRDGRTWIAPARTSLMATIALCDDPEPATLSLALAASVARSIETRLPMSQVEIRWPNDVLAGGKKVAGVLADYHAPWVYLGFGINLLQTEFPDEISATATSLLLSGGEVEAGPDDWVAFRNGLLAEVIDSFVRRRGMWRGDVEERLWARDRRIDIESFSGERIEGVLSGLLPDGRLEVKGNRVHHIAAGEVSLHRGRDR